MVKDLINEIELIVFSPDSASKKYFPHDDEEAFFKLAKVRRELLNNLDRILSENEVFEASLRKPKGNHNNV